MRERTALQRVALTLKRIAMPCQLAPLLLQLRAPLRQCQAVPHAPRRARRHAVAATLQHACKLIPMWPPVTTTGAILFAHIAARWQRTGCAFDFTV